MELTGTTWPELINATNNCIISAVAGRHAVRTAVKMVLRGIDG